MHKDNLEKCPVLIQVMFDDLHQKIVAAQAPSPDRISGFWQMVWDQDVSVIVMLEEKMEMAEQYWPDSEEMNIENNLKLENCEERIEESVHRRKLFLFKEGKNALNT